MNDILIKKIVEIIKDYRREDLKEVGYNYEVDYEHVNKWIIQFNEYDREFILSELLHLLPSSYLTEEKTFEVISNFEVYSNHLNYTSVQDFLDETVFLDCQEERKSQKVFNNMIDKILNYKYGFGIAHCGKKKVRNWFYIDDVLASGRTFKDDLISQINNYGIDNFKKDNIQIIAPFIILHQWGKENVAFSIEKKIGLKPSIHYFHVSKIENYPRISKFNSRPKFNHIYPLRSQFGESVLDFIEKSYERGYEMSNSQFAFRNENLPTQEIFFSTPQNRIRYENILLQKGYEIMNRIYKCFKFETFRNDSTFL